MVYIFFNFFQLKRMDFFVKYGINKSYVFIGVAKMTDGREFREKKNFRIKLQDDTGSYPGIITTISRSGMSVKTEHVFPTFKVIDVIVKIGESMVPIKGSVRWVHEAPHEAGERMNEMGISLQSPPYEYVKHFE